jgi:hypothetical protein
VPGGRLTGSSLEWPGRREVNSLSAVVSALTATAQRSILATHRHGARDFWGGLMAAGRVFSRSRMAGVQRAKEIGSIRLLTADAAQIGRRTSGSTSRSFMPE